MVVGMKSEAQQQDRPSFSLLCRDVPGQQAPISFALSSSERGKQHNSWEHCQGQQKRNQHNQALIQLDAAPASRLCSTLLFLSETQLIVGLCGKKQLHSPPFNQTSSHHCCAHFKCP